MPGGPCAGFTSYIICTSPRSGSTLLCGLLAATGVAGRPDSHFHGPSLDRWITVCDLAGRSFASRHDALLAVFRAVRERGTGGNGIFGLRMQWGSFPAFTDALTDLHPDGPDDAGRIEAEFGRTLFVHLTRPDKIDQAISRVRAEQTGLWHRRADGTELERLAAPTEAHYDRGVIARHVDELTTSDVAWNDWFDRQDIDPLRLTYDELARDPAAALARLLAALDLDPGLARGVKLPTAKLADVISRDWRNRFDAETGNG